MTVRDVIEAAGRVTHDIGPDSARSVGDDDPPEYRVTVDLDDADPFDVRRAWNVLRRADADGLRGRVSSSGEGCHLRGFLPGDGFDAGAVERVRYLAGDHPRRTYMDRTHVLKPTNITFSRKADREAGPWRRTPHAVCQDLLRSSERFGPSGWSP